MEKMFSWEEIVQNDIVKNSNLIQKTTRPLKDHFGIEYFTYHKIDNQGNYTVLVDRPDWAETYVSEKIYLNDPYLRNASNYKSGISKFGTDGSEEYKEKVISLGKRVISSDTGVILVKRNESFVEFFGFCGNSQKCALEQLFIWSILGWDAWYRICLEIPNAFEGRHFIQHYRQCGIV